MENDINGLVSSAKEGDRDALESLVKSVQDRIYRLSLKMLYQPADAEDATQEIVIRIITKLGGFREESSFVTWALTIASNHLKNKVQEQKKNRFTFLRCEDAILKDVPDQATFTCSRAEQDLVVEEMRILCMQGLLQCLDADSRLVYILGNTMDLNSVEGSAILGISPEAFRKRLSRARESIRSFLIVNCDLFDTANPCNCSTQAQLSMSKGNIQSGKLRFTGQPVIGRPVVDVKMHLDRLDSMAREVAMMRMNQDYKAPEAFINGIKEMLDTKQLTISHP